MTSAMQGEMAPSIDRVKFGSFEVANICDGTALRDKLHPSFGGNQPAEAVHALARDNRIDAEKYVHCFIPTLVNTGRELVLFDTGFGPMRRNEGAGKLIERMGEAGYSPEDVDIVVLTHGHPDHVAGLIEAGKPAFPNARYVIAAAEFDYWNRGENIREARKATRELFVKVAVPLANQTTFIKPGDEVVPGIRSVDAAGHSAGMLAFMIESEGRQLLIWADTGLHYVISLQQPDWPVGVDDDTDKAAATRRRIFDMCATDKLWVAGFHMPFPGFGFVEKAGSNSYRWVPVSYQLSM